MTGPPAPRFGDLPRDVGSFTGRAHELDRLAAAAAAGTGLVGIYAVGELGGVGTTALAVHAAHHLAGRFPDGQVFLPLHGHSAGPPPADPAAALASLLLAAGLDAGQIPDDLAGRARLWRGRLAGRRVLLVLDDAAGSEQVAPLLPGTGSCLVLVTSRPQLTALDGTAPVSLDVLPAGQAADLLARLAGRPGLEASDPAAAEIAALCGYLPLALALLGGLLAHRPAVSAAGLAAGLAAELARAGRPAGPGRAGDGPAAAAFSLAYRDLPPGPQRLLRRLGRHPGTDVDAWAAAALDDSEPAAAARSLAALAGRHLITEPAPGRYRLHELLREYAAALATADGPAEADAATGRLLGYLADTAAQAGDLLARHPRPRAAGGPPRRAARPALAGRDEALGWLRAERPGLLAGLGYAAARGRPGPAVALTAGLSALLRRDGPWPEALALCAAAAAAAAELGDRLDEAGARRDLAAIRDRAGDYAGAAAELEHARRLYQEAGSEVGEAAALSELGVARYLTGDYRGAIADLERSLELYLSAGSRPGEAAARNELGNLRGWGGDLAGATRDLERSVELCRELGDLQGQASAHGRLGALRVTAGDFSEAARALRQALDLYRDLGDRLGEAVTQTGLAVVQRMTGDYPGAIAAQQRALAVYRGLGRQLATASGLHDLGVSQRLHGDLPGAIQAQEQALEIFRGAGHLAGQAVTLNELGVAQTLAGDYRAASGTLAAALEAAGRAGRPGEAEVLNNLGTLHLRSGDARAALDRHQRALDRARAAGSPLEEARALEGAGRAALGLGQAGAAADWLDRAVEVYQSIGAAEATRLARELAGRTRPDRAGHRIVNG